MTSASLNCVSLFSGCGGLDLGLERAGFRVEAAIEMEPLFASTYRSNFQHTEVFERDLLSLTEKDIRNLLNPTGKQIDLLAAGPPCPAFSKSRFWRTDLPRGVEDPKGLGGIEAVLRAIDALSPRAFLIENVRGITYRGHRAALDQIVSTATKRGYEVQWAILNAADYGVPQLRERCFIVGVMGGQFEFPARSHSKDGDEGLLPYVTAGEAIGDLDTEEAADPWGHTAGGRFKHLLEELPPGENYLYFTAERGHPNPVFKYRSRYWTYLLKLSPTLPSWTIQAKRTNNMGPLHWRNRILRIGEVKRLQTFPDEFNVLGDVNQKWRQLGNAVPPVLAQAVGGAVREAILRSRVWTKVA